MRKHILFLLCVIVLTGCEDYLDRVQDSAGMNDEDVYSNYLNFRQFQDRMYKDLHNYMSNTDFSYIGGVSDEGYLSCNWETLPIVQNGDWLRAYSTAQAFQFTRIWNAWQSIRIINLSLENLDKLKNATDEQKDQLKGQAHFMRAWYYYEFLRRQGGMPYITWSFTSSDDFALSRLSYHETALNIVADCDSAFNLLPQQWNSANMGRPTKGAALALKASTYLFDASPMNSEGNSSEKWMEAASAAWDVLDFARTTGAYRLLQSNGTDQTSYTTPSGINTITYPSGFDSIFMYQPYNDEIIWEFWQDVQSNDIYSVFATPNIRAGHVIQGYSPSANIVDMFETQNGLAIHDDPSYNSQNPYINRDPRFYHSILFNGQRWTSLSGKYLELFNGGLERKNEVLYSRTGYLARKFWGKNTDQWSGTSAPFTHSVYFRLAEMYLIYAEAANEIGGPSYQLPGADISAVDAVNIIRARVNMPPVDPSYLSDKESFRERIKNERAVELFLEGKRLFDLSRWGDAHKAIHKEVFAHDFVEDNGMPTGYQITKSTEPVMRLTFEQRHYRWPIPVKDALMNDKFKQNPGW